MIKIQLNYDLERGQYYKGRIYVGGDTLEIEKHDLPIFFNICQVLSPLTQQVKTPEEPTPPVDPETPAPENQEQAPNASGETNPPDETNPTAGSEQTPENSQEANKTPEGDGTPKAQNTTTKPSQNKRSGGK